MRRPRMAGGLLVAICAASVGCFWLNPGSRSTALMQSISGRPATTDGGIYLTSRLLDGPAGDPFLSTDLWTVAGKPLSHEATALLARNGMRVGVLSGMIPPEFSRRIGSERLSLNPRLQTTRPGVQKVVAVQGPLEHCEYHVLTSLIADPARLDLQTVECGLAVTATPAENGRVRLECEFQVQHGDKQVWLQPKTDGSGFVRQDRKALETYPSLAFAVELGPSDYLVLGPTNDPFETLGQAFFVSGGTEQVRTRVLVIQAGRVDPQTTGPASTPARAVLQD